jgi:SPP1 family predicted phage head-tail adaptor
MNTKFRVKIGEMNHYISLQYRTVTRDASGAEVETWTTEDSMWAKIESLTGREYFAAQQNQSEIDKKITIRVRRNVTADKRFIYGNRVFEIKAILPDEVGMFSLILCIERE